MILPGSLNSLVAALTTPEVKVADSFAELKSPPVNLQQRSKMKGAQELVQK